MLFFFSSSSALLALLALPHYPAHNSLLSTILLSSLAFVLACFMDTAKKHVLPSSSPFPALPEHTRGCFVRIILCRHGETDLNARRILQGSGVDPPLNSCGKEQAILLAERLRPYEIDLVVSSHLLRARETAAFVSAIHPNAEVATMPYLSEISWGIYEGMVSPDLKELHYAWDNGNFDYSAPNGESPIQVCKRAEAAIERIVSRAHTIRPNGIATVVVVAHGRFLRIAISWLIHKSLHFMNTIAHYNCNINVIDVCKEDITCSENDAGIFPLSGLPRESILRISQSLVDQQTTVAHTGTPAPLASAPVALSKGMSFDKLVCGSWDWVVREDRHFSSISPAKYIVVRHSSSFLQSNSPSPLNDKILVKTAINTSNTTTDVDIAASTCIRTTRSVIALQNNCSPQPLDLGDKHDKNDDDGGVSGNYCKKNSIGNTFVNQKVALLLIAMVINDTRHLENLAAPALCSTPSSISSS